MLGYAFDSLSASFVGDLGQFVSYAYYVLQTARLTTMLSQEYHLKSNNLLV